MKAFLAVICVLAGATILSADNTPAVPATPATTVAPVKPGTKAKKEVKKEEEPVISGQTIARANGTYLGLELAGGFFKLTFYDAKKKPMTPDADRAAARWPNSRHADLGPNRAVLNRSGDVLIGNKTVVPPLNFTVFITLLKGESDDSAGAETFAVPFHG